MMRETYKLKELISLAQTAGLPLDDIHAVNDFLSHHEFGLCFDQIVVQLSEHEINIDASTFLLIDEIGRKMQLPFEAYSFMKPSDKIKLPE